jgi:hypothetical protein
VDSDAPPQPGGLSEIELELYRGGHKGRVGITGV